MQFALRGHLPGRFPLLCKVRVAKAFGSLAGRRHFTRLRLMAFYVLFQSNPNPGTLDNSFLLVCLLSTEHNFNLLPGLYGSQIVDM